MPGFSFPIRLSSFSVPDQSRYYLGIHLDLEAAAIHGCIVRIADEPESRAPELMAHLSRELSRELTAICRQWIDSQNGNGSNAPSEDDRRTFSSLAAFRHQSVDVLVEVTNSLLQASGLRSSAILLAGVLDPGLWFAGRNGTCVSCLDASVLAFKTGLNFCDGFIQSDLSAGGLGGPVEAGPLWRLLASDSKNRLVLDLRSEALRLFWLPPELRGGLRKVLAFDAAPGMELLNQLVRRISYDKLSSDPSGKMAVQGKKIPELLNRWKSNSFFQTPLPRYSPLGIRPNPFILEAMNLAVESNWSVQDVLCTAVHFQADCLSDAVQKYLTGKVEQIYLRGPGCTNGLLCREIRQRIPNVETVLTGENVVPPTALYAACAAVLAYWFAQRTPGNLPQATGCSRSVVLGRLIPGLPESFLTLSEVMARKAAQGENQDRQKS